MALSDRAGTFNAIDLSSPALGQFNIERIDLEYADDSILTLTEAQVLALSSNTDTVVVSGGADDTLNINGAVATGETVAVDGRLHTVYTLGDSATLIVDQDINTVI